uniref:Uncharacterized protein n=1 Tax=Arundo donax TaxID=35708 RepID=A0A0A9DG53_ARUDO
MEVLVHHACHLLIVHIFQHMVSRTTLVTCGLVNFQLSFCVISLDKLVYVYMESEYLILLRVEVLSYFPFPFLLLPI